MKSFGRLLMAAALIVPAGVAVSAAGRRGGSDNVICTTNTGTLKFNLGLSLTVIQHGRPSRVRRSTRQLPGIGITDSTGARFNFTFSGQRSPARTSGARPSIGGGQTGGHDDGSNAGHRHASILSQVQQRTRRSSSAVRGRGYLGGEKIRGTATIPPDLRSAGDNGGKCGNSKASRVRRLDYTNNSDFTIG